METSIQCPECQSFELRFQAKSVSCNQCAFTTGSNATCKNCERNSTEVACLCAFQTPICNECWPSHAVKPGLEHKLVLQWTLRNVFSDDDFDDLKAKTFRLGKIQGKVRAVLRELDEAKSRIQQISEEVIKRVEAETRNLEEGLEDRVRELTALIGRLERMKLDDRLLPESDLENWAQDASGKHCVSYPETALADLTPLVIIQDAVTEEMGRTFRSFVSVTSVVSAPTDNSTMSSSTASLFDEGAKSGSREKDTIKCVSITCKKTVETGWFASHPVVLTCGHVFHDSECFFNFLWRGSNWFQNHTKYQCPVDSADIHQHFIESVFGKKDFAGRVERFRAKCWVCSRTEDLALISTCKHHHHLCPEHKKETCPRDNMPCPCHKHNPWM